MKAVVFTEAADTVDADSEHSLLHYYKGQFRPVTSFVQKLSNFANTDLYILSSEYGVCQGSQSVSELTQAGERDQIRQRAQSLLLSEVKDADIVVLLLTKSSFTDVVEPIWQDFTESAKPESIWGLGLPQSVLDAVDLESLKLGSELYIYPRVGVARIDIETRKEILGAAQKRASK